jgi:hypothetical protein
MLSAADGCGIDDLTPGEVVSAAFTVCYNTAKTVLDLTEGEERKHNEETITSAIGHLYTLVIPKVVN